MPVTHKLQNISVVRRASQATTKPGEKIDLIPLSQIVNKFDVRVALDQDRVLQFAGLYEGGADLPPVKVVRLDEDSYAYIDGRTRGAARAYLNWPDVEAIVCNGSLRENPIELFAEALEANWGGAKPPTREDISHTIVRMMELGATQKSIRERLTFLPGGAANAYIAWAKAVLNKRRMSKALDAVAEDGLSVASAAEMFKLKPELLKKAISGKRGNWGAGRSDEAQFAVTFKQYISKVLFSANAGIGKKVELMLRQVDEGEISSRAASSVIKAWHEHLRKTSLRVADWQARLDAISTEQDRAVAAKV